MLTTPIATGRSSPDADWFDHKQSNAFQALTKSPTTCELFSPSYKSEPAAAHWLWWERKAFSFSWNMNWGVNGKLLLPPEIRSLWYSSFKYIIFFPPLFSYRFLQTSTITQKKPWTEKKTVSIQSASKLILARPFIACKYKCLGRYQNRYSHVHERKHTL